VSCGVWTSWQGRPPSSAAACRSTLLLPRRAIPLHIHQRAASRLCYGTHCTPMTHWPVATAALVTRHSPCGVQTLISAVQVQRNWRTCGAARQLQRFKTSSTEALI
jgi:hypothetical protein